MDEKKNKIKNKVKHKLASINKNKPKSKPKDFFSYNPFINNRSASLLTVMIDLNDLEITHKLLALYHNLTGEKHPHNFHITLFSMFINVDELKKQDDGLYSDLKRNFRKIVIKAIQIYCIKLKNNIKLTYLNDNNIENYEILGRNSIADNFFAKVFYYNQEFVNVIERLKIFVLNTISKNNLAYHSHDDLFHYYTLNGSREKLFAIHHHYDYTEKIFPRPFIHATLCRVNKIKNIFRLIDFHQTGGVELDNEFVLNEIFKHYLKKKENIAMNKNNIFTLYPDKDNLNKINVTHMERKLN
jgi:hypothetical protein